MKFTDKLKHAWNIFRPDPMMTVSGGAPFDAGPAYYTRPDRTRLSYSSERSIISSIYTRLALDVASVVVRHARLDEQGRYLEDVPSGLNNCFMLEANLDQAAMAFRIDVALTLFDKGCLAIVPINTSIDPKASGGYDILSMRVGHIVTWYPDSIRVSVYNEAVGRREEMVVPKRMCAIVENPFYSIMNETNSTLQRLIRKLNLLDASDDKASGSKLDLIIQLPYVIKSEARREQARQRARDIEFQLKTNEYGIAYTDGTEKITQLNRPAENTLLKQIEMLVQQLYTQLGLTEEIMNGTADAKTMLNYYSRTIQPIVQAYVEAMRRSFLTKTARTQRQTITYFKDPFSLVPAEELANIADKFTRNEVLSSNEIRGLIGFKPSTDPKADELRNSNMPDVSGSTAESGNPTNAIEKGNSQNGSN